MCGICGVLDFHARTLDPAVVQRMNASFRHRGPDDEGVFADARSRPRTRCAPTGRSPPRCAAAIPYSDWLRGRLRGYLRSVLLDPSVGSSRLFDRAELERAIGEHERGERDHGFLLDKVLNLALWVVAYGVGVQTSGDPLLHATPARRTPMEPVRP